MYVINVEQFFDRRESAPVQTVMRDSSARNHYEVKRIWQLVHESVCKKLPAICGNQYTIFRSRETGTYHLSGVAESRGSPVSYDQTVDRTAVENEAAIGRDFLSFLSVDADCVILTMVPSPKTGIGTSRAIASALGMTLLAPSLDGLRTFDGSHLDKASAERWSDAFLKEAGPQIRRCVSKP